MRDHGWLGICPGDLAQRIAKELTPSFIPQEFPALKSGQRPILRIVACIHYIGRITGEPTAEAKTVIYAWADYQSLRSLPLPHRRDFQGAKRRSLFRPDGLVPGSERAERFLFWPMGVPNSGAQYQWDHHVTAFVGRRHFGDQDLLERVFELRPIVDQSRAFLNTVSP